jgi:uncharacterized protein (UPF0335 family)
MTKKAEIGHNSDTAAASKIKSFVERVEKMESEKRDISQDIKEIFAEAKSLGFDTKTIKKLVKLRSIETDKRREEQALLETYAAAIQMDLF